MAHSNTIFHQLLDLLNRHDFRQIEKNGFRPKRKYRTLDRWSQFVVMMFAQITGRASLRDILIHKRQSLCSVLLLSCDELLCITVNSLF